MRCASASERFACAVGRLACGAVVCAALAGCAEQPQTSGRVVPSSTIAHLADPDHPDADILRVYRLGVGDKLKLTVFGEPDLSGDFQVNAAGSMSLPLIGELPAKGHPIEQFRREVIQRLSEGYLKNPRVTIEILSYRPFYVSGEVRQGGELQYKTGVKIRDAIAMAGGYSYRADHSYIYMTREGEALEAKIALPNDMTVLPGDNIRVPERFF